MTQSLLFDCDGETAARAATQSLVRHGLQVVRSFDLHSALAPHADCECPHHGTEQCTCQFVVLTVYGQFGPPVVVTAHGRDDQAEVQVVRDANTLPEPWLAEQITWALLDAAASVQSVSNPAPDAPTTV